MPMDPDEIHNEAILLRNASTDMRRSYSSFSAPYQLYLKHG